MFQAIKDHIAALENKVIEDLDTWIADLKALVDKAEKAPASSASASPDVGGGNQPPPPPGGGGSGQ